MTKLGFSLKLNKKECEVLSDKHLSIFIIIEEGIYLLFSSLNFDTGETCIWIDKQLSVEDEITIELKQISNSIAYKKKLFFSETPQIYQELEKEEDLRLYLRYRKFLLEKVLIKPNE